MNFKLLMTGVLLIVAVGAGAYVLVGGDGGSADTAASSDAGAAADAAAKSCDTAKSCDAEKPCHPGCTGNMAAVAKAKTAGLPDDGVVVYYFHGYKRCATCKSMESLAALAIDEGFAAARKDGGIVFRAVNIETDETRHFVDDFQLVNKCVVMVSRRDGKDQSWRRLDEVWAKIGDESAYKAYIAENLAACLKELEQGPS